MTLGSRIAYYRKEMNITQEALAQQLNISNQAVSKWESDQCCPDILLLPRLADIFQVSLDQLFGREQQSETNHTGSNNLPWEDDGVLRAVLYMGTKIVEYQKESSEIQFAYDGAALNIFSAFSVTCGDVEGNVEAGECVTCGDVEGNVEAEECVTCGDVGGDINVEGDVTCGDVDGNIDAGGSVTCGDVDGNIDAEGDITCGDVQGDVSAGRDVTCGNVDSDIDAGGSSFCRSE